MAETLDFDALYAASYRRLVVQLYALCGDLGDAEDAVQEAFVAAIRKQRVLAAVDNPEAWLRTVALNRLRNHWRHSKVAQRLLVQVPGPRATLDLSPDHVALVAALQQLDATSREVVVLHHLAGLPVGEVAHQLGMAEGTVKSRLSRSRARLAGLLDDKEAEPRA